MSWQALGWAASQYVPHGTDKLILIGLADRYNSEDEVAFPSIDWLVDFSSHDRKTVILSLDRLEAAGLIEDSGERRGRTRQIKAYRLRLDRTLSRGERVSKTKGSQKRNGSVFPSKESQKRDSEPYLEPTSESPNGDSSVAARARDPLPPAKPKPKAKPTPKTATVLPDDFEPVLTERAAGIVSGWSPERYDAVLAHFRDYHLAKGSRMLDWQAAFRMWIDNEVKYSAERRQGNGYGNRADGRDEIQNGMVRAGLRREAQRRAGGGGAERGGYEYPDNWSGGGYGSVSGYSDF